MTQPRARLLAARRLAILTAMEKEIFTNNSK